MSYYDIIEKPRKRLFLGTRSYAIPLGELTRRACGSGATIARRIVNRARGACPHT
jgi:hypothetical protein